VHDSRPRPLRVVLAALLTLALLPAALSPGREAESQSPPPAAVDAPADVPAADATQQPSPAPLMLDAPPEPLPPDRRRTEAEEDHVEALARFAAARSLEAKRQYAAALRDYQRAARYDPRSQAAADAAVRLAAQLDRLDEAVRYAARVQKPSTLSSLLWMRLGIYLTRKDDWSRAARMYENALAARSDASPTVGDVAIRLELGRLDYLLEDYRKAAEYFARVREALKNPESSGLDEAARRDLLGKPGAMYALFGTCFLRAGRTDEAVAAFEESDRAEPNKGLLGYNLAQVEAKSGKPAEALDRLQTYFDEHLATEGVAPYSLLSDLLKDLGKQDELVARLEKLRAGDGENVPLSYFLAEAYHKAGRLDQAEPLYRTLVQKTPTITGFRALVEICRQARRPEDLFDVLGEAAVNGVAPESFGEEGSSIAQDADLVRTLIEIARKRHEESPDQLGYGPRLATALLALEAGQFETAGQLFDWAVQADRDRASETFLTWGLGLLSKQQYGTAAGVFQRGIDEKALAGDSPVVHFYLSGALELAGRTEEALAAARKAIQLDPDSPRFQSRLAWILYRNDRHQEAADAYARLIEKFDPEFASSEVRQVVRESRMVLSNLAVLDHDLPLAERWLQEVLDEFPDDVGAMNDLGYLWADRNVHLQRAQRMIREAVEADPGNAAYRDSLGWVLYRLGQYPEALAELEKAVASENPPDPEILDHLGDVYLAAGQPDKAREAWSQAARAFEQDKNAERAKTVQEKLKGNP
jgi:tetratricopeptide (TPR) repeat protein